MKFIEVSPMNPKFTFHAKNEIVLTDDFKFHITTDEGVLHYTILKGAIFDGRSGPNIVDNLIPKYGDPKYAMAWLTHDCNFDTKALSFHLSNELFYQMLVWAGVSKWRAKLAFIAVDSFIGKRHYYTDKESVNQGKIKFEWSDR